MATLSEAADKLSGRENRLEKLREKYEKVESIDTDNVVQESFLKKEIKSSDVSKVAGVDGGLLKKRYSSGDVIATRAVAAVFSFNDGVDASYYPSRNPEPGFEVFDAHEADSLDRNAESERLKAETSAVKAVIGDVDRVFLDGSIVPSYLDDDRVLENYTDIFESAESGSFVGVVEDSYGLKLSSILEDKTDVKTGDIRDTLLMDVILEEGERSFVRKYSGSAVEHPTLQKLEDRHVNRLYTFYVKLSDADRPLRIDYFGEPEDADGIAGALMALKSSRRYTIPSPVVEADKRAKIPQTFMKRLEKRFSPEVRRRERRLF